MAAKSKVEILVVGAGIAGIATAYFLCTRYKRKSVLLVDSRQAMSFTSAQSGDNYRNWWPHPTMTEFTNFSIDLMEQIATQTSNVFNMRRRGYVLATRNQDIDDLVAALRIGYGDPDLIRRHSGAAAKSYVAPVSEEWRTAPNGVDILSNQALLAATFPSFSKDVANVIHIRRAGEIDSQQLAQYMLERIRGRGGKLLNANVLDVSAKQPFEVELEGAGGLQSVAADVVVNAAGPFAGQFANMMDIDLPIENVYQQKIAFEDSFAAIPRQLPFSIDLDAVDLNWDEEERELLLEDAETAWLTQQLPGGVHCRPDGGDSGSWIKLGWAYNDTISKPQQDLANEPLKNPQYPEIVMRAAARLHPALGKYAEDFPTRYSHYGGYYPMTKENWPLIGPLGVDGAFVVGALSGFGSMSACAAGAICGGWISGNDLPAYAAQLSPARYADSDLMTELTGAQSRGIL